MDDSSTDSFMLPIVKMEDSDDDDIEDILLSEIISTDTVHPSMLLQPNAAETCGHPCNAGTVACLSRNHARATAAIHEDFFGPSPLYNSHPHLVETISIVIFELVDDTSYNPLYVLTITTCAPIMLLDVPLIPIPR
mmetsp:Transcript_12814/g.31099  ORF Transcript_12814/g.31099 Transcript_12814/m.31099 type:complete len:136 (-) Transcript_12814:1348-1755(-)